MKLKQWQNISHVIVNANSIVQCVIQINNGMMKHVNVNVKIILRARKIKVDKSTSVTECGEIRTVMILYQQKRLILRVLLQEIVVV